MPLRRKPLSAPAVIDPILTRIRSGRLRLGLTYGQLAERAGLRSPAYVFHIENGHKYPGSDVAVRLAVALGEDQRLFSAWAVALQRGSLQSALDAADTLLSDPELGAFARGEWTASESPSSRNPVMAFARLRVPVIPSGADPGEALRPSCEVLRTLRLDPARLGLTEAIARPFAYVLSARCVRRAPDLGEGRIAIVSRGAMPEDPRRVYAVRTGAGVELARVQWNGAVMLLEAAPGHTDFEVVEAQGEAGRIARLLGSVVRVLDP